MEASKCATNRCALNSKAILDAWRNSIKKILGLKKKFFVLFAGTDSVGRTLICRCSSQSIPIPSTGFIIPSYLRHNYGAITMHGDKLFGGHNMRNYLKTHSTFGLLIEGKRFNVETFACVGYWSGDMRTE
ncbi:MAG: hypothetical protein IKO74_11150 [Selenomonadaceae bacterium]|nr:hypothetical protein [Selenomonadaceae bacterium]